MPIGFDGVPGGDGYAILPGDILVSNGATGRIDHFHNGSLVQVIFTRGAVDSNGRDRELEAGDMCFDSEGNLYVCIEGLSGTNPVQWGGPQIEKFDNTAHDLGRWDQNVFYDRPTPNEDAIPECIRCLADDTFLVLGDVFPTSGSSFPRLWHLTHDGFELNHWDLDHGASSSSGFGRFEIDCAEEVIYYGCSMPSIPERSTIFRWNYKLATQMPNFVQTQYTLNDQDLLYVPADRSIITIEAEVNKGHLIRRDQNASVMWDIIAHGDTSGVGESLTLDVDGETFWSDNGNPITHRPEISQYRLLDGAYIRSVEKSHVPVQDYTQSMETYYPNRCPSTTLYPGIARYPHGTTIQDLFSKSSP